MEGDLQYDVAVWETHETEDDCTLVIRTNNGCAFYCEISPSEFARSPLIKEQYFKCRNSLRSGEDDDDNDFYIEDACDWLSQPFVPLIQSLASCTLNNESPTLDQYLFPRTFVCSVTAVDEKLQANELPSKRHDWGSPIVSMGTDSINSLSSWTRIYNPSQVELCYKDPKDTLIKPPRQVTVCDEHGNRMKCYYKRFERSSGPHHARMELLKHRRIIEAQFSPPPEAFTSLLYGVVVNEDGLAGMLFLWIDNEGVLSKARAEQSTESVKQRWVSQIKNTLELLHSKDIIWGDVKAENVLIDSEDNAWIIDFGGSLTVGWVDEDKAGTKEGDLQGLAKIIDILT